VCSVQSTANAAAAAAAAATTASVTTIRGAEQQRIRPDTVDVVRNTTLKEALHNVDRS